MLDAAEIEEQRDWADGINACTCTTTPDAESGRYVVSAHSCPHCLEWDRKLRDAGVRRLPRHDVPDRVPRRSRRKVA